MEHCDRVVVLSLGSILAEGSPAEIRNDPAVQSAYLGDGHDGADGQVPRPRPAGCGDRRHLLGHGIGSRPHLLDIGHLQLRPRRSRLRRRLPLLPAALRSGGTDRAGADRVGVHLRAPARAPAGPSAAAAVVPGAGLRQGRRDDRSAGRAPEPGRVAVRHRRQHRASTSAWPATPPPIRALQVPGIGPNPADEFNPMHGVAINSDQLAVFIVADAGRGRPLGGPAQDEARAGDACRRRPRDPGRAPRREPGPHLVGRLGAHHAAGRPRRRPHRAACSASTRTRSPSSCSERWPRSCSVAFGHFPSRSSADWPSGSSRTSSPATATTCPASSPTSPGCGRPCPTCWSSSSA